MNEELKAKWDEIVRINHDVPAIQAADAELTRLSAIVARVEDVEGMAKVLFAQYSTGEWDALTETAQNEYLDSAIAVSKYAMEGK